MTSVSGSKPPGSNQHSNRPSRPKFRLIGTLVALVAAAPFALAGCGGDDTGSPGGAGGAGQEKVELSIFWWGGEARAKLTEQALDLYTQRHPNVTFKKTWQANQGYYDKLATLVAGNDAPDIFQIDDNALTEYAERGATLDLNSYRDSGKLDLSKFPESLAEYGVVDGKLSGVALGENTQGLVYNKTLVQRLGVEEPQTGWTWDQLIDWAADVSTRTGGNPPGTMDPSADYKAFWIWLRQQDKDLYEGKELGFTADDVASWFELWKGARDRGATPTPDVIKEGNSSDITKQLVVTGKAATSWVWANQMPELKKSTKDELGVCAYPGDPSAQWARASQYFSVFRNSEHKDVAVDVINFLVNDVEAAKILGTERGLPSNLDIRKAIGETVTDAAMKQSIQVENDLASKFGDAPQVPPKGHSTVRSELVKAAESVQFGKASPAQAAEAFVNAAKAAVSK